jgi:hypothetical protein
MIFMADFVGRWFRGAIGRGGFSIFGALVGGGVICEDYQDGPA